MKKNSKVFNVQECQSANKTTTLVQNASSFLLQLVTTFKTTNWKGNVVQKG